MGRPQPSRFATTSILTVIVLAIVAALQAQLPRAVGGQSFLPNGMLFPNENGTSRTISVTGRVDLTGPFFQSLGTNGRSCSSCHQPGDGMSVSAAHVQQRFDLTEGLDPIFRTNDGSNCDTNNVSTLEARIDAYSLLRTRGLIRVAIDVPANANYVVTGAVNPYGCDSTSTISMYRRPLPSTNLRFLSAVMSDGRESSPATGTTRISFGNYPTALVADLKHQSLDATNGHAQGTGLHPTAAEQQQIVDFEMGLLSAQATGMGTGRLNALGANGGPDALVTLPFFISINSSIHPLVPTLEQPGSDPFNSAIFNLFDAWAGLPSVDPRAAVARGQTLFNTMPITITDVAGINDDAVNGGLVSGGIPAIVGTCGTCHDTPNVGDHSSPTPLDIGTGDPMPGHPNVNLGGLDISYLPEITACKDPDDPATCRTTTDLGQALIDGNLDHIGKIKGPILRGLSSRAPYFHNGSAKTLLDVVHFYEVRFGVIFTPQQESDVVAFLSSL